MDYQLDLFEGNRALPEVCLSSAITKVVKYKWRVLYSSCLKHSQLSLLLTLIVFSNPSHSDFLDSLHIPNDFNMSWVSRTAIQNGHRLEVAHFHSGEEPASVLEHFRQIWLGRGSDGIPDFVEEEAGKWHIISTISEDKQLVVQVTNGREGATHSFAGDSPNSLTSDIGGEIDVDNRAHANNGDGSSGFISRMELDPTVAVLRHQLPEPANSTTVSITHSDEAGVLVDNPQQNATTAILVNEDSLHTVFQFYRSNMKRSGWSLIAENSDRRAAALMYQRNSQKCEISLVSLDDGQTLITLSYTG